MKSNRKNSRRRIIISLMILFVLMSGIELIGQCPMCRMAAESNMENGGSSGKGLNEGILYMLSIPYLSLMLFSYILYKNRKTTAEKSAI